MSNPFDDLESDQDDSDDVDGEAETMETTQPDPAPTTDTREEPTETDPADAGPAFEYGEVRQKPIYARGESWDEFEKTFRTTIAPTLAESGVVDEETREVHDALLRLATEQPERVAELILEARRGA